MWQIRQVIISRSEPEIGCGTITAIDREVNILKVYFGKIQETRRYSLHTAPLQRFAMEVGDCFIDPAGSSYRVESLSEEEGIIRYIAENQAFWEHEVRPQFADQGDCLGQLLRGQTSDFRAFELRREAWQLKSNRYQRQTSGFGGARITPLPHQLYIAAKVSRCSRPRAIIADEVGLGKTIEAGLIFAALKDLGKADRVLIITPESLVNQWVAELYRRFGEVFAILDAARCQEEEGGNQLSPFQTSQRIIVSEGFFAANPERFAQALEEPWDLVIIDEAHHLRWDEDGSNQQWLHAEALSKITSGLLLLTATPQHYGWESLFGLLKLLAPERYNDAEEFYSQTEIYQKIAIIARAITRQEENHGHLNELARIFGDDSLLLEELNSKHRDSEWRGRMLTALLDRFGTGRLLFRNRRAKLRGFPERKLASAPLEPSLAYRRWLAELSPQSLSEGELIALASGRLLASMPAEVSRPKPRLPWLVALLERLPREKILVLCASRAQVEEIAAYLKEHGHPSALFHEELSVIERDKQAAKFVADAGVSLLIASEIGGEGRNFQCARHLVIMDLPRSPDLLEQRIGRLDRIGQGAEITIHVPWIEDSPEEALFRWYQQGLNAFAEPGFSVHRVLEHCAEELVAVFGAFLPQHPLHQRRAELLAQLLVRTRDYAAQLRSEGERGEEFLLDLNSFDETRGAELLSEVEDSDDDTSVEFFMRNAFEHYGVDFDEFDDRGSLVIHGENLMFLEKFPGIAADTDTLVTFDRSQALAREDMLFLTADHPLVESTLGLMLERNEGAASICQWERSPLGRGFLLECSFVLEAKGPKHLELNRYLPIACKEIVLTHQGRAPSMPLSYRSNSQQLREVPRDAGTEVFATLQRVVRPLGLRAQQAADIWAQGLITAAIHNVEREYLAAAERLRYLLQVNPAVSVEDLRAVEQRFQQIIALISESSVRLDGVRGIFTQ